MPASLRGAPTMLIGAVVRDFSDPFFADAIEALAVEAMAHGYNIVLGHIQGRQQEGLELTTVLETRHCDAIMMLGDMQDQPRLLADLRRQRSPWWRCGREPARCSSRPWTSTTSGRSIAGLEHLIGLGHERIGMISARLPGDNPQARGRVRRGHDQAVRGVPEGYVQRCASPLAGGEQGLRTLLALPDPPTAVACSTDLAAVGVLHAAISLGGSVPDGLSVVGFDDLMFAPYLVPALTTVRMPTREIVVEGLTMAIEMARDPTLSRDPRVTVFEPSLVVRGSTAPPA